jgi:hypothetical protein
MNTDGHRSERIISTSRLIESGFVLISVLDSSVLICVNLWLKRFSISGPRRCADGAEILRR